MTDDRRFWRVLLLIVLAALALRVGYVLIAKRHEPAKGDQVYYVAQANTLAHGDGFTDPRDGSQTAEHPPLTALALTPTAWLAQQLGDHDASSDNVLPMRLTMTIFGALVVLVIGLLGRAVAGNRAGLIAAALAAVYPNLWVNDGLVMSETLATLAVALAILFTYRFIRTPKASTAAWVGVFIGLAMLARAELGLLLPLMVLPVVLMLRVLPFVRQLLLFVLTCAVTLAVVSPWLIANLTRFDDPVLFSTNDGLTLCGANIHRTWYGEGTGVWALDCAAFPVPKGDRSVVSNALRHDGLEFIKDHLSRLPAVVGVREARVWNLYAPGFMANYNENEGRDVGVSWAGFFAFWILVPCAVYGAVLLRRRRVPITPLVSQFVIVAVTAAAIYGLVRFRVPAEVSLVVLAAVAFDRWLGGRPEPAEADGDAPAVDVVDRSDARPTTVEAPAQHRRTMLTTDPVVHDVDARRWRVLGYALLALLAYVPVLLTKPGKVVADTKSYLYLDPGRLLERAFSMWDPNIGMGTVTHQNIGYLFPMGPYYWAMHLLGVPAWVSQRLWLGSILFVAALGVLYLLRTLHVRGPGVVVGAVVFMLTPYTLDFAARISVILLPWAALPWMLALTVKALRTGKGKGAWKYPAMFAIVVQIVGGVNATALIFAGIAPVLWILYAWLTGEVDGRRALMVTMRIGVLTLVTSLWWIAGLWAQAGYGLDVLKYTETLQVVSLSSLPSEVLRGLGYWFFYGIDRIGHWTDGSVPYTQNLALIGVSFLLPILALASAMVVRWRHRAYFVLLVVIGATVAVGANPFDDPSALGGLFKSFAETSSFGLALRSTSRAVPLVALGLAVLLATGVNAVAARWADRGPQWRGRSVLALAAAGLVIVLAIVNLPALWTGDFYTQDLTRAEDIPQYWTDAIAALDAQPHDTRVLEIPGSDFAAYRWGQTVDPITPGLMDRPYVARELVPWGSAASADLLNAFDRRLQEGVLDPAAVAPVARLMSAGSVLYRADLQTDRYDLARAVPVWRLLTEPTPDGLSKAKGYGTSLGPPLRVTNDDAIQLALPADSEAPPPVSVFQVADTPSIVRSADASAPVIVSGDGEGVVDLASIGALGGNGVLLYSASYAADPKALQQEIAEPGSVLIVTDSNRKRARRWTGVSNDLGATERADEAPLVKDENDNQLDVFPDQTTDAQTVVQTPGVAVTTSRYGDPGFYEPEYRGARAFDDDVSTSWQVGAHARVIGERLRLDLDQPITTDHVNLVQPQNGPNARYLTQVDLSFDGGAPVTVNLDASSRTPQGQTVTFPSTKFSRMELRIADTNVGDERTAPYTNSVGFAEIRLQDDAGAAVRADEIVRMPTDLVDAAGRKAADRPLVYQMSRSRTVLVAPATSADEVALVRRFRVPDERTFGLRGTARLATDAPDAVLDSVLGIPDASDGGITVTSSQRLPGDIAARGSSAFDDDPTTWWSTDFGAPAGQWIDVTTPRPVTFDHLDLQVVADGKHSVPTQLQIDAGGQSRTVDVPAITGGKVGDAPVTVPVTFAPLTGSDVRITVTKVRDVTTLDYDERQPSTMPVAIAEVGIPGVQRAAMPAQLPADCRDDLVKLDGAAVPMTLDGSTADAAAGRPVDLAPCRATEAAGGVTLERGDHTVRSTEGKQTGIDVDGMVFGSDAGGTRMALGPRGELPATVTQAATTAGAQPHVKVTSKGSSKIELTVSGARKGTPFWLVLGESHNAGWEASVAGTGIGGSTLVDAYANGWRVDPPSGTFNVTLTWTPQTKVWIALGISAVAVLLCLVLALRRRRVPTTPGDDEPPAFANPLVAAGSQPTTRRVVVGALVTAAAGALLAAWWVGLVAGAVVVLVALRPKLRVLVTVGAPLALAVCALYVIVQQHRHHYPADLDWPPQFTRVNEIAWLAVVLLLADVVIEFVRRKGEPGSDPPPAPDAPTP